MSPPVHRSTGAPLAAARIVLRAGLGMAVCVFSGYGVDRVAGTSPWFLVAGAVLGAFVVMLDLFLGARRQDGERGGEAR